MGSALLVPCSLALINRAYPDPAGRASAVGVWMGCGGIAMASGPLVGGLMIHWLGWRSIFFVNIPVGLAGLALTRSIARDGATQARHFDLAGQAAAVIALGTLIAVLIEGSRRGWHSTSILSGIALSAAAWFVFLIIEKRRADPMFPLRLFRNPLFAASTLVSMASAVVFYGLLFMFSIGYQTIRGDSPLQTGLAFLPMTIMVALGGLNSGRVVKLCGTRGSMCVAFGLYTAGSLGLLSAGPSGVRLARRRTDARHWTGRWHRVACGDCAGYGHCRPQSCRRRRSDSEFRPAKRRGSGGSGVWRLHQRAALRSGPADGAGNCHSHLARRGASLVDGLARAAQRAKANAQRMRAGSTQRQNQRAVTRCNSCKSA